MVWLPSGASSPPRPPGIYAGEHHTGFSQALTVEHMDRRRGTITTSSNQEHMVITDLHGTNIESMLRPSSDLDTHLEPPSIRVL